MASIITKILNGLVQIEKVGESIWNAAEAEIEKDWNAVKAALPASAQVNADAALADLKQAASDAITTAASAEAVYAPTLAKGIESVADSALAALLGGFSVPLIPVTNAGIDKLVDTATATLQSWALKAKATLANTNTLTQGIKQGLATGSAQGLGSTATAQQAGTGTASVTPQTGA